MSDIKVGDLVKMNPDHDPIYRPKHWEDVYEVVNISGGTAFIKEEGSELDELAIREMYKCGFVSIISLLKVEKKDGNQES